MPQGRKGCCQVPPPGARAYSPGLHIGTKCRRLGAWWRKVGEICQQLLHKEFYGFSYTQTSQIWDCWIDWAYFNDESGSMGLSQGLRGQPCQGKQPLMDCRDNSMRKHGSLSKGLRVIAKSRMLGGWRVSCGSIWKQARAKLEQRKNSLGEEFNSSHTALGSKGGTRLFPWERAVNPDVSEQLYQEGFPLMKQDC